MGKSRGNINPVTHHDRKKSLYFPPLYGTIGVVREDVDISGTTVSRWSGEQRHKTFNGAVSPHVNVNAANTNVPGQTSSQTSSQTKSNPVAPKNQKNLAIFASIGIGQIQSHRSSSRLIYLYRVSANVNPAQSRLLKVGK